MSFEKRNRDKIWILINIVILALIFYGGAELAMEWSRL